MIIFSKLPKMCEDRAKILERRMPSSVVFAGFVTVKNFNFIRVKLRIG